MSHTDARYSFEEIAPYNAVLPKNHEYKVIETYSVNILQRMFWRTEIVTKCQESQN